LLCVQTGAARTVISIGSAHQGEAEMKDPNTDGQPISENLFRRLVVRLTAQQLRDLPVDRLPASIPFDVVDAKTDPAKYAVLNELAWTVGARELERRC
jgi:hypothetical protein